jgi:hypothetical protein
LIYNGKQEEGVRIAVYKVATNQLAVANWNTGLLVKLANKTDIGNIGHRALQQSDHCGYMLTCF